MSYSLSSINRLSNIEIMFQNVLVITPTTKPTNSSALRYLYNIEIKKICEQRSFQFGIV